MVLYAGSAPTQFNDPFDHQTALNFQFDEAEFQNCLADCLETVVFGLDAPEFEEISELGRLSLHLRRTHLTLDREEVQVLIQAGATDSAAKLLDYKQNINKLMMSIRKIKAIYYPL